jgi:hypothetical protein
MADSESIVEGPLAGSGSLLDMLCHWLETTKLGPGMLARDAESNGGAGKDWIGPGDICFVKKLVKAESFNFGPDLGLLRFLQ